MHADRDLFISHADPDRHAAEALAAGLEAAGATCWLAPRDVPPGVRREAAVEPAIASSTLLVLVLSPQGGRCAQVRREVEAALDRGKPVLPVRLEGGAATASAGVVAHVREVLAAARRQATPETPPTAPPPSAPSLPPLELLTDFPPEDDPAADTAAAAEGRTRLEQALRELEVAAQVTGEVRGPALTRYEVTLEPGTRVSRLSRLADSLALALAATDVRVEAPTPGYSTVGIEVARKPPPLVGLGPLLATGRFPSLVSFALGVSLAGKPVIVDLATAPHILVAGASCSGKSTCLHAALVSMLMRATPEEVRFLLIDPKRVELSVYEGLPHLQSPVVRDVREAWTALRGVLGELEARYERFARCGVHTLAEYNARAQEPAGSLPEQRARLPRLVIVIDELADLMMQARAEFEGALCRIAQLGRAVGIHLVVATQRPAVSVLTGCLKANLPTRIAFAVATVIDSRTILDTPGAERLVGRGDMLYLPLGAAAPLRVQGAFVSASDLERVTDYLRGQGRPASTREAAFTGGSPHDAEAEADELLPEAEAFVRDRCEISTAALQRRFRIGYQRAGRLLDALSERGLVGPPQGCRPRQVLPGAEEVPATAGEGADDTLYAEAERYVRRQEAASVAALQRRFLIGYARAARLIESLEQRGVVGPPEGRRPRRVLAEGDGEA